MISQIKVKNFRLLRDITLDIKPGTPVVLIGPNSAGKSTLLEVLDLISFAVANGLQKAVNQLRQGVEDIRTAGCRDDVEIGLLIDSKEGWSTAQDGGPILYKFSFTEKRGHLIVTEEHLAIYKQGISQPPLVVLDRKGTFVKALNVQTRNMDETDAHEDDLAIRTIQQSTFYPTLDHVREVLKRTTVYSRFLTAPSWGRSSQEQDISPRNAQYIIPTPRISKRGLDLITALYHIHTNYKKTAWWQLEKHFTKEFPFVEELSFPPTPRGGDIALAWKDRRFGDTSFVAGQMSEGMINYLCLLAAILVPDTAAALGFDEPDNNIHPSAVSRLVHLFERRANDTAIIIATHSNQLLDYLSDPAESVVVCTPTEHGTELARLDRTTLEAWREEYSISQLREQGHVDPANEEFR